VHEAGSASEVVRYLAPGDSEGGGTWIAVSERGLCLGLLNAYGAGRGEEPESPTSRGLLIPDLIDAHSPREVAERLAGRDLFSFRPFVLLAVAPGPDRAEALVYRWDGLEGRREPAPAIPISSSGVEQAAAELFRREHLRGLAAGAGGLTPSVLRDFHRSHADGPGALTPCMHRPEAETRSSCRIRIDPTEVRLLYTPGAPCRTVELPPFVLERRAGRLPTRGA
jgi:hypothetical protein